LGKVVKSFLVPLKEFVCLITFFALVFWGILLKKELKEQLLLISKEGESEGMISLITSDATAIHYNQPYTTSVCLLINLIILTFTYNRLFMRDKNESTLFEKIVLIVLLLVIIIGSIVVLFNTSFLI